MENKNIVLHWKDNYSPSSDEKNEYFQSSLNFFTSKPKTELAAQKKFIQLHKKLKNKCYLYVRNIEIYDLDFSNFDFLNTFFLNCKFAGCTFKNIKACFDICIFINCTFKDGVLDSQFDHTLFINCKFFNLKLYNSFYMCSFHVANFSTIRFNSSRFTFSSFIDTIFDLSCISKNVHFGNTHFDTCKTDFELVSFSGLGEKKRVVNYSVKKDLVWAGCFTGNIKTFIDKIKQTYSDACLKQEYLIGAEMFNQLRILWLAKNRKVVKNNKGKNIRKYHLDLEQKNFKVKS